MFPRTNRTYFLYISGALLLISACNVFANAPTPPIVEAPTEPIVTEAPTQPSVENPGQDSPVVTVDLSYIAQDVNSQVVEAVPASADHPWWEVMPQYTLLTLNGYPTPAHLLKTQIFVFPVEGLMANETAGGVVGSLQTLLQSQGVGESMPYLPLYNAAQVMHTQVKYMDFKNGRGVRYLTQFDQAMIPINNYELHYTFQGLTDDGLYYVAAVLPVNLSTLPMDASVDLDNPPANFIEDFPTYLAETVDMISGQPANAFIPDLDALDAMMGSLEIK